MRIALAQINPTVGALAENRDKILAWMLRAREAGAHVVVFPELALTGYPPEDLLFKKSFLMAAQKELEAITAHVSDMAVVLGATDMVENRVYNAAAVLHKKKCAGIYHKMQLPNYGVFDEQRYFAAGASYAVIEIEELSLGVSICEDVWAAKHIPYIQSRLGNASVLLNLSSSPYDVGKLSAREAMLEEHAKQARAWICYVNLVGGQDELVFDGASLIVAPDGSVKMRGKQFAEDLIVYDLDTGPIRAARSNDAALKKDADQLKQTGIEVERICLDQPSLDEPGDGQGASVSAAPMEHVEEVYNALVLGTRDYVRKNGFKKVVIGLSGGIDSALVALIASDAIGKENTITVSMPSEHSSEGTKNDARDMAVRLGVEQKTIPISAMLKDTQSGLRDVFAGLAPDKTEENLQARIRGMILMALSNKFGWLVLATGNKSELSVGYCTLYGDMVGGFAVIKDVPKALVYTLARWRSAREKTPLVPDGIFDRPPSAELRPGQKDEDDLPPYEMLDPILQAYIEEECSFREIVERGYTEDIVRRVLHLVDINEYKRRQAPPGIKISPKAFGKDRRIPITNKFKDS